MPRRNPYRAFAGYVASRPTGPPQSDGYGGPGWVVVYRAEAQGIDPADGGPWAVVCETHGTLVQTETRAQALATLAAGSTDFCDCCRDTCGHGPAFLCPSCGRGTSTLTQEVPA